jgi:hypothetical protein
MNRARFPRQANHLHVAQLANRLRAWMVSDTIGCLAICLLGGNWSVWPLTGSS